MVKKKVYLYKMPDGSPYISKQRVYGTTYKQSKGTGLMSGRKMVKGEGDKTGVRRVTRDFVLVKKSNRARGYTKKKEYDKGQIVGRY